MQRDYANEFSRVTRAVDRWDLWEDVEVEQVYTHLLLTRPDLPGLTQPALEDAVLDLLPDIRGWSLTDPRLLARYPREAKK